MVAPREPIEIDGEWHIPYNYSAGASASRFLIALRDEGQLLGTRCGACNVTFVPGRHLCSNCFAPLTEWLSVGPEGTIETFTICYESYDALPVPPFVIAVVKLDGADTNIVNFLEHVDLKDPDKIASMRVRAVFKDDRQALITDFHFEPLA